jgi:tRNA (cmo5U34)-methyltransferase
MAPTDVFLRRKAVETSQPFSDPAMVACYAEDTPLKVPGYHDLHRMAMLLLAEHAPSDAEILVVGAGGGLEIKALAEAQPHWRFVGVDPSAEMLDLANRVLGPLAERVELRQGLIDAAPMRPLDGATCLLTMHFLSKEERLRTLREIRGRLKPGAPFIAAHHSAPAEGDLHLWLSRSVAFANRDAMDSAKTSSSAAMMAERLPLLSVEEDEALLREAGFSHVALFYAAFTFRGWVAVA